MTFARAPRTFSRPRKKQGSGRARWGQRLAARLRAHGGGAEERARCAPASPGTGPATPGTSCRGAAGRGRPLRAQKPLTVVPGGVPDPARADTRRDRWSGQSRTPHSGRPSGPGWQGTGSRGAELNSGPHARRWARRSHRRVSASGGSRGDGSAGGAGLPLRRPGAILTLAARGGLRSGPGT